jgi:hypothetical protein
MYVIFPPRTAALCAIFALLVSCGGGQPALFPCRGEDAVVIAVSRHAAAGELDFARPKKLEYRIEKTAKSESAPRVSPPGAFGIEYACTLPSSAAISGQYRLTLEAGGDSWVLPMDAAFWGTGAADDVLYDAVFHYAAPFSGVFPARFSIALVPAVKPAVKPAKAVEFPRLRIRSVEFGERWYGFYRDADSGRLVTTPFVYRRQDSYVIEPPAGFGVPGALPELSAEFAAGTGVVLETGGRRFEASPYAEQLRIPAGLTAPDAGPAVLSGGRIAAFQLRYAAVPPFPAPIAADPGLILAWPRERWRGSRYELFRWDRFPSLLIFDTADYAVQDRMFKRLAFFTEKAGFRGRLAGDAEIAALHGWNAHDYRAQDIARFFDAARAADFPLLPEERELERLLLAEGVIRRAGNGGIEGGEGGVISVSRQSPEYLRARFMVHECFHGLFFIDEDFRAFSRQRWERLPAAAKRFITSYFGYQQYDITDDYLMVNEFMAYILQQPVSQAGYYFGENLPGVIDNSPWRRTVLPPKDAASGSWPALAEAFTREAEAFSAYVNRRWGLAAGRVHLAAAAAP